MPGALIFFLERPELFLELDFAKVLLLSAAIGFPVLLLCFACIALPRLIYRGMREQLTVPATPIDQEAVERLAEELEWPVLGNAGTNANLVLYSVAAVAYFRPIAIGSTMLLVALLLTASCLLASLVSIYRGVREKVAEVSDRSEVRPGVQKMAGWLLRQRGH